MSGALLQKIVSYGYYYSLIDIAKRRTDVMNVSEISKAMIVGVGVGTTTSLFTNPISVIKYHQWGNENYKIVDVASKIKQKYGMRGFMIGIIPSFYRNSIFTTIYILCKPRIYQYADNTENKKNHNILSQFCIGRISNGNIITVKLS